MLSGDGWHPRFQPGKGLTGCPPPPRFGSPLSAAERKQRAKDARDKDRQADKDKVKDADKATSRIKLPASPPAQASTSSPALAPAPPLPPSRPLKGVAEQAATITGHVVSALLTRELAKGAAEATPAPGVVLSGLAGAGKTALVRELAKGLATDKRTLTRECGMPAEEG